ncbi:BMP family ABC transporter substrate-binding protein [Blastococcus sp. KM273128]|uniref:BMP family lipoprotein n=1 Tax=Blastococcus sp. KM273128 TaxID=2570314 RepID=UPI001F441219|nr:BMP family ABC transporter substrate-binding protein [Blastococcus sp. KM273128]MCF6745588.1 BMP family ABC transporter substrate-binding protein [Blastococcus sp. KM273128]
MRRARMTKAAALLLAGSLALAACASDEEPTAGGESGGGSGSEGPQVGLAYDVGGRGDQSFNDSAYAGVEAAITALDGDVQEFSPNDDGSDRVEGLANLAEAGYDPVIGVGFAYAETIAEVAEEFPDTTFAVVDSSVAEMGLENATGLLFAEEQGSFLAGVAAALKSETDHVGFVGGVEMPLIQKFEAGFTAGAQAVNPDIQVDVEYISPAGDFSGFGDPARGQILARSMYDAGADIVFHAAGGSGSGVFQAAAETGNRAIGVDSDQYQTVDDPALQAVIMTSMLKRVDNAVEGFITDYSEGTVEGGVDLLYDLESDGVGLATSGGQIDDIQTQIEDYRQQIISGEITVPSTP